MTEPTIDEQLRAAEQAGDWATADYLNAQKLVNARREHDREALKRAAESNPLLTAGAVHLADKPTTGGPTQ